jgi:hypothetical protein
MLFGSFTSLPVPSAEKISKRKIVKSKYYVNQLRIQLKVNISKRLKFSHTYIIIETYKVVSFVYFHDFFYLHAQTINLCVTKFFGKPVNVMNVFLNVFEANNVFCFLFNIFAVKLYPVLYKYIQDTNEFIRIVLDIYNLFDS